MITKCNLPESITLPTGEVLMPVIGGTLKQVKIPILWKDGIASSDANIIEWARRMFVEVRP